VVGRAFSRRELLAGAGAAALLTGLGGCRSRKGDTLRLGFMTNLTHAPVIAGIASGRIERAVGAPVEPRSFRAGPRVLEALMGDAIDAGSAGPSAIVYNNARHGAGTLRLVAGCCSGGASFVVGPSSRITGWEDLRGKTLATAQIGTTQDISLRKYLHRHGYAPGERGGDVTVTALDSATVLTEMRRGALDGAWLAEPWATRLVRELGAVRLVDERELWPGGVFPTALVVARGDYGRAHEDRMARLADAIGEEVDRARRLPDETRGVVGDELARLLGKRIPDALLAQAWPYVDFTRDPLLGALDVIAEDATTLGLAPPSSHATLMG
jgi:NitT/TauT family transport system substrate-binding protein